MHGFISGFSILWFLFPFLCQYHAVLYLVTRCVQLFATPWTVAHQAPLFMGVLQARILEWVAMPSSRGSSWPRYRTQVSCIAGDSLPSEPPGKPKNTEVGCHALLQGTFLTQVLNPGPLHCRWIHYQLSYQGSPYCLFFTVVCSIVWSQRAWLL